ncbi:MAG: MFS transporter [Chloroflexi bacterium]|nr:MFS transporter [Chloroflexota bacterium]
MEASRNLSRSVFNRYEPGIWVITVVAFLTSAGFSLSIPFLALYLHQQRGLSMTLVGSIILVTGLCSAITQMFGGALADRFGRRPLLLNVVMISALLYFGMAFLIGASAAVPLIVLVFTAVRAVLMTQRPAIGSVVIDLTPKHRLTETFGLIRVGQNIGWAAGPAIGGYLATVLSYAWLFAIGGLIVAIAASIIFFLFRESLSGANERMSARSMLSVGKDHSFLSFTALSLLVFVVMGQMGSTLSVFTVDRAGFSTAQYGFLLTLNGIVVVLLQYPVSRLLSPLPKHTALALGGLFYGLGYLMFSWVGGYNMAMAAIVVITLGENIFTPTSYAVVGESSPEKLRGHYTGFFGLSETLGISLGPLLGGILLDAFPAQPLRIWGAVSVVAFIAAIGFQRWRSR